MGAGARPTAVLKSLRACPALEALDECTCLTPRPGARGRAPPPDRPRRQRGWRQQGGAGCPNRLERCRVHALAAQRLTPAEPHDLGTRPSLDSNTPQQYLKGARSALAARRGSEGFCPVIGVAPLRPGLRGFVFAASFSQPRFRSLALTSTPSLLAGQGGRPADPPRPLPLALSLSPSPSRPLPRPLPLRPARTGPPPLRSEGPRPAAGPCPVTTGRRGVAYPVAYPPPQKPPSRPAGHGPIEAREAGGRPTSVGRLSIVSKQIFFL